MTYYTTIQNESSEANKGEKLDIDNSSSADNLQTYLTEAAVSEVDKSIERGLTSFHVENADACLKRKFTVILDYILH